MKVTFVKKILVDGEPCPKCTDVERRLTKDGYETKIDRVVVADERDPNSEGMLLAVQHGVALAPFFIVEDESETRIHTVYFKFREEFELDTKQSIEDSVDLLRDNPELDLL